MGIKGLWSYIEHHQLLYQYPQIKPDEGEPSKLSYALRPEYLVVDMNAVIHSSYSSRKANTKDTLAAVLQLLEQLVKRFQPSKCLALVFDGVSPLAKLYEQKQRRTSLSPVPPKRFVVPADSCCGLFTAPLASQPVPLSQSEISCGSEFVLLCEERVTAWAQAQLDSGAAGWGKLHVSSCREDGEGEVKIAQFIRRVWQDGLADGTYCPDDAFSIVGNDSDLFLVSVLAVPYMYFTLIDPVDYHLVAVKEVFDHWRGAGAQQQHHQSLPLELLPSYRVDFVFLMLLSGSDYYEGVPKDTLYLWRRYRDLRMNEGFYRRGLVTTTDFRVDVELLRKVLERKGPLMAHYHGSKNKRRTVKDAMRANHDPHAVAAGLNVLRGALWSLKTYAQGRCVNYNFKTDKGNKPSAVTVGCLRAAASSSGLARKIGAGSGDQQQQQQQREQQTEEDTEPCFRPLEQYVAILGVRGRYSPALTSTIARVTGDEGRQLTTSTSTRFLKETVQKVFAAVECAELTGAERLLLDPIPSRPFHNPDETFVTAAVVPPKPKRGGGETGNAKEQED